LEMYGGLDASRWLARRPDWSCMADWTPVGYCGGVQIGDVWRIGRHLRVGAASRLGLYGEMDASEWLARRPDLGVQGGMDASGRLGRRPDLRCRADWTPVGGWRGVQIGVVWRIGRQWAVGAASRFEV